MKYIVTNFNNDISWLPDYTDDYCIYDKHESSEYPSTIDMTKVRKVPNLGADLLDKFSWIVENYDNLPDCVAFVKGNLFKYISREEFDELKDNRTFTPLLTKHHKTEMPICFYENGIYNEINNYWYVNIYPCKSKEAFEELKTMLEFNGKEYLQFAPGANYIVPKENILKHPKEHYQKLISYLDYMGYSGEAQMCERGLYTLWNIPKSQ